MTGLATAGFNPPLDGSGRKKLRGASAISTEDFNLYIATLVLAHDSGVI